MKSIVTLIVFSIIAVVSADLKFSFHEQKLTYEQALQMCMKRNQILLEVRNSAANRNAWNFMKIKGIRRMWLGINRRRVDSDANPKMNWVWEKGVSKDTKSEDDGNTFWGPHEPNNYKNHSERCGEMRYLAKNNETANWNDRPCDHLNPFVCITEEL